jgi:putative mycofactocin binding protein MftB
MRGILEMTCRLAEGVQVRKESWGLLFYSQPRHRLCFVRSGDWLYPEHFNGHWTFEAMIADIGGRTGTPAEIIERSMPKLAGQLTSNGMIVHEL